MWSIENFQSRGHFDTEVSSNHFSSGFEYHRYETDEIQPIVENYALSYLRYPGGTQTENYFDPSNPNDPNPTALVNNAGSSTNVTTLSEFLNWADSLEISAVIVLPTWRYFDTESRSTVETAEQEIKEFVSKVLAGEYGDADIKAFEIGNEWFNQSMFDWTAQEFGELQSEIALWIQEAIAEFGLESEPDIWVQSRGSGTRDLDENGVDDNIELLAAFSDEELAVVDGITDHFYQPTRYDDVLDIDNANWVPSSRIDQLADAGWNVTGYDAIDVVVTEWNVRADRAELITGFERLPMFLGLFSDMIAAGVDFASVWTLQALGEGDGCLTQQNEADPTPTGLLFEMLLPLEGSKLVDFENDSALERDDYILLSETGEEAGYSFSFESENTVSVFWASGVNQATQIAYDFSGLFDAGYGLNAVTGLNVQEGQDPLDTEADGEISAVDFYSFSYSPSEFGVLGTDLAPYEVMRLDFVFGAGAGWNSLSEGYVSSGESQTFYGTENVDIFMGNGSADLVSYTAADAGLNINLCDVSENTNFGQGDLFVSIENLKGSYFCDTLIGDEQDNVIWGAAGDDTIHGSAGDDELRGDRGDDVLIGGAGADALVGGSGTDTADYSDATSGLVVDLQNPENNSGIAIGDTYESVENLLGSCSADILSGDAEDNVIQAMLSDDLVWGCAGDDVLIGYHGTDTLYGGIDQDSLYGGEGDDLLDGECGNDELRGDAGNDVISGGFGADTVIGGTGNDTLNGSAGSDLVFGGDGDDFVNGGWGCDLINGGEGADRFYHHGITCHGSDWIHDYDVSEGDVLIFGLEHATDEQFQLNTAHATSVTGERSGDDDVEEAFVIYEPTGQIIWALVDGGGQSSINLQIGSEVFDLVG